MKLFCKRLIAFGFQGFNGTDLYTFIVNLQRNGTKSIATTSFLFSFQPAVEKLHKELFG